MKLAIDIQECINLIKTSKNQKLQEYFSAKQGMTELFLARITEV